MCAELRWGIRKPAPPFAAAQKAIEALSPVISGEEGLDLRDTRPNLRQIDPLVGDEVWLDFLSKPPVVHEFETNNRIAPLDGTSRMIVETPVSVAKKAAMTGGPVEF